MEAILNDLNLSHLNERMKQKNVTLKTFQYLLKPQS